MDDSRNKMIKMLEAMESTEKWNKLTRAKNELFRKKLDIDAAEKFSEHVLQRLVDTCNDKYIFGSFYNWELKSVADKISITDKIVKVFIRNIKDDILQNRIQLYNRNGSKYNYTNDTIDTAFKEDIINSIPNLEIQDRNAPDAMMGVSRNGTLYINYQHPFYQKSALFFLMDLKHELTHFIDIFIPSISIIDPEINMNAQMFYVNPQHDLQLYDENPLEINANTKRKDCRIKLTQMLKNQESTILASNINNTK